MIRILLILCLSYETVSAQVETKKITLECSEKLNQWAIWQTTQTTMQIIDNFISIQEVPGIVLAVEFDTKQLVKNLWHYSYQGSVRITHSMDVSDGFLITVLNDHYKCKVKI